MPHTHYDQAFYARQRSGSANSASLMVPWLVETFRPRRVIDVGCGVGTWAAALMNEGVDEILGIDGDYVDRKALAMPESNFKVADLADEGLLQLDQSFDLSVCLEVAEHLPPSRAESFVRFVTSLAPIAVFGAAVPGQGGVNHVNEQWQSYWAGLFARHGFVARDVIRPRFWTSDVQFWYAQNTLVYTAPSVHIDLPGTQGMPVLDLVHPRLLTELRQRRERKRNWLVKLRKRMRMRWAAR